MSRRPTEPDPARCTAVLWNTGKPCRSAAAPDSPYCLAHLVLVPPEQWAAGGYAAVLDRDSQPLFRSARFADVSDEIALTRLHLRSLVATKAPGAELLSAVNTLAKLVKLRQQLDQARSQDLARVW